MSLNDRLSIFLAVMTMISTLTGVIGTYVTFSQFKRESEKKETSTQEGAAPADTSAPTASTSTASTSTASTSNKTSRLAVLKSKLGMFIGFIVLAVILGVVWKGTLSTATAPVPDNTTITSFANMEEETVNVSNSKDFHGGSVSISLNSIDAKDDSGRHFATFTVLAADGKSQRIKSEEVGFSMNFEDFNIRVISVGAGEARFAVRKKGAR